jgi:hypothetical protein
LLLLLPSLLRLLLRLLLLLLSLLRLLQLLRRSWWMPQRCADRVLLTLQQEHCWCWLLRQHFFLRLQACQGKPAAEQCICGDWSIC